MQYIVTNFAYGTGPYLMTAKLALAFNDELEKRGRERMKIIVPLVYGEKQKRIIREEFGNHSDIFFDEALGTILKKAFYANETFEQYLQRWTTDFDAISKEARNYLEEEYGNDIALEINRSPRLIYGVAPAHFSSFGLLSRVFNEAQNTSAITIDKELLKKAASIHEKIEQSQKLKCIGSPGLASGDAVLVPPIGPITEEDVKKHGNDPAPNGRGIFVTRTGIPNPQLDQLYNDVQRLGRLRWYENAKDNIHLIESNDIEFHFARSGWASIWRSLVAEKPIIVPEYISTDDPEIYFNNRAIEKLGIGVVYQGGGFAEIIKKDKALKAVKQTCREVNKEIKGKFGTLDGIQYTALKFAEHFVK